MLIDTHCHLDFADFKEDLDQVIQRAQSAQVNYFINPGSTLESCRAAVLLADRYPQIYAAVGVHPHDADTFDASAQSQLEELAGQQKVVAIGETGLDYYRNLSSKENQRQAFLKQIALAKKLNLPLIIHCRQAEEETLEFLKGALPLQAVVHCFSGNGDFLKECLDLGFFVSYTCNITYPKAQGLREVLKLTPLDRLMLETDAPYLSPDGFRGKRNEPTQVKLLAQAVSLILGISLAEIEDCTTRNAKGFFKLS
jgi:TatD DNase family protein